MKLIEWFWPKDMREMVKKFRAEGTLNEKAVKTINEKIQIMFTLYFCLGILFYTTAGYPTNMIGLVFCSLAPVYIKFDIYRLYKNQMAGYVHGTKTAAVSLGTGSNLYGDQRLHYMLAGNNAVKGVIKIGAKPRLKKEDFFPSGQELFVYWDGVRKCAMPDVSYLKKAYSLTNKIFEEYDNA